MRDWNFSHTPEIIRKPTSIGLPPPSGTDGDPSIYEQPTLNELCRTLGKQAAHLAKNRTEYRTSGTCTRHITLRCRFAASRCRSSRPAKKHGRLLIVPGNPGALFFVLRLGAAHPVEVRHRRYQATAEPYGVPIATRGTSNENQHGRDRDGYIQCIQYGPTSKKHLTTLSKAWNIAATP